MVVLVTTRGAAVPEKRSPANGDALVEATAEVQDTTGGERLRRSGDVLGYIGTKIGNKISSIASASGSLSAASSHPKPEYGPPPHEEKSFDFWAFKKALLSTLLQAVKAIKGGLLAIKGQLIKVKGNIISSKGRLIASKGEAISNFGKHLASSALMLDKQPEHPPEHKPSHPPSGHSSGYSSGPSHPPSGHSSGYSSGPSGSAGYGASGSHMEYGGPPPPASSYGIPSGPSSLYGAHFIARASSGNGASAKSTSTLPGGAHAGLLVIKPIQSNAQKSYTSNLHDFFAAGSQPVAAIVAAPGPFGASSMLSRSDSSSLIAEDQDFSVLPEFSPSYDF